MKKKPIKRAGTVSKLSKEDLKRGYCKCGKIPF